MSVTNPTSVVWHAVVHATTTVLAYMPGKHKDEVFQKLKALLDPSRTRRHYTDGWAPMNDIPMPTSMKSVSVIPKK
ncbi:MAG: hypothetical protein PHR16_10450 [Methylovulum sp.]|nr:hypothetical protein [Methylovulum sp.]